MQKLKPKVEMKWQDKSKCWKFRAACILYVKWVHFRQTEVTQEDKKSKSTLGVHKWPRVDSAPSQWRFI